MVRESIVCKYYDLTFIQLIHGRWTVQTMLLAKQYFCPVTELLVSRTGITQTPVLFENFKKLKIYRIGWDQVVWKPTCPAIYKATKKYFENIRNIKCSAKNISVPDTATCEASSVGAALGIVWDINDPTVVIK